MDDPRITTGYDAYGYPMTADAMTYESFLNDKSLAFDGRGIDTSDLQINTMLFPFQEEIVRWALNRGRAAIFADCGLGKTPMQLEWATWVYGKSYGDVLIVAPLAVSEQTQREADKFGIEAHICRTAGDLLPGINITNYERLHHFDPGRFAGIVLDESSILKAYDGATKQAIIDFAAGIPYRLACTATPAPNDYTELCNHAEFLGVMQEREVKALFFTQDGNTTTKWRLKRHAEKDFWRWMASWSVAIRKPSDMGHDDDGFVLPALHIENIAIPTDWKPDGELFGHEAITLSDQRAAMRESLSDRVQMCAAMVNDSDDPWVVWCNLNAESDALARAIDGAIEVKGSDDADSKADALRAFSEGRRRVIVTKPSIAGFGMNWQHCAHVAFVGLSHSFEQFYQAVRRVWRFGQTRPVHAYIITADVNSRIVENIKSKEKRAAIMMKEIVDHMTEAGQVGALSRQDAAYAPEIRRGEGWALHLGDCVDVVRTLDDDSVGLSVFSPPFPGMYVYSNSTRDMGNTHDIAEMVAHMGYMTGPLLGKMMPGRSCCIHLTQGTAQKMRDGYIGLRDFRGAVIEMMGHQGWIYYGEVCIDKNPQVKAIRTKDRGLLFKTLAKDSAHMHMALADYLLQFRRPGDNPQPIAAGISERYKNDAGWITPEEWIRWARPVWYAADWAPDGDGISETDVLNVVQARETNDERHLAPLQLGVIRRAVRLWSAPGDLVFSPFAGIGSEGYVAIEEGRRFVGAELKRSYWESAIRNLVAAEHARWQGTLFENVA